MFYAINANDYTDDPENCTWYECEGWVSDVEDAVQNFMEYTDDDGDFGRGDSYDSERNILIYDDNEGKATLVSTRPDPSPGYSKDPMDDDYASDELETDITKIEKPKYEQIS